MSLLKICASAAILLISCSLATAGTQTDINAQACIGFKQADAELNRVYQGIMAEYRQDHIFVEKMKKAQRAWVSYRDAHLESIFPEKDKRLHYGSMHAMCDCTVMKSMTIERTKLLKQWVTGITEGDVCAGSMKSK